MFFLKKNCLFKFDISILSLSVNIILDFSFTETPIKANIFIISHTKAPAPTIKIFKFFNFSIKSIL